MASGWPCRWVPTEDLVHECRKALIEAVDTFDLSYNNKLSTYAGARMRTKMSNCTDRYREHWAVPFSDSYRTRHLDTRHHGLWHEHGPKPSLDDILGEVGCPGLEVPSSCSGYLPHPKDGGKHPKIAVEPEGMEIVSFLVDGTDTEECAIRLVEKTLLSEALKTFPGSLKLVLQKRYGVDGFEPHTLRKLAEEMSISPRLVRKLHKEAEESLARTLHRAYDVRGAA